MRDTGDPAVALVLFFVRSLFLLWVLIGFELELEPGSSDFRKSCLIWNCVHINCLGLYLGCVSAATPSLCDMCGAVLCGAVMSVQSQKFLAPGLTPVRFRPHGDLQDPFPFQAYSTLKVLMESLQLNMKLCLSLSSISFFSSSITLHLRLNHVHVDRP